ncbi:calcium-binding protein CML37-like [Nicotiana tomentosiformis]|uniref:calcium-binding protein CML37-like n=1 Tax=Nicotiana tomentosiformis TaxID=4098 RepID=UPI00388C4A45
MCMESVSVPSVENKSYFSRLRKRFSLKKATTTTTTTTTITTDCLSMSSSSKSNNSGELERVFTYFDENGDGKVSPAELRRCVKAVGGELTVEEAEMAVRLSDSDGDGLLGLEDFTKLMEGMEEERNKESELIGAFGMYEMEGSGYITPKSLKMMLSRLGESTSIDNCKAMIQRFDINGDGVLNFDEVFTYFDENGDGKVSPAELRRCVKAVGGELTVEEAEMAVRLSDSDGDGLLVLEDFTKLMEGMEEERNKESELIGAFGMYEMEGSGYITPKSLKRMLSQLGESTSIDNCKAMIRRFDINGDGVLSFDEFKVMMTS